jgi:hypothetical protein
MLKSPFHRHDLYEKVSSFNLNFSENDSEEDILLERKGRPTRKESIDDAIEGNNIISFYYVGDNSISSGFRIVEPYVRGIGAKGQQFLRAYQLSKPSKSENKPYWRLFNILKMRNVKVLPKVFWKPKPLYNPNGDALIPKIEKRVSFKKRKNQFKKSKSRV